jgi:predicted ATP-binding protein involved in virulence
MRIQRIEVTDLFNLFNHAFSLNERERVTILYGPNGYGKTAILRLIDAVSSASIEPIRTIPFSTFSLTFDNNAKLIISKSTEESNPRRTICLFESFSSSSTREVQEWSFDDTNPSGISTILEKYPYLRKIGDDLWEDTSDGEIIPALELYRRFNVPPDSENTAQISAWLKKKVSPLAVRLIETQRLLMATPRATRRRPGRERFHPDSVSVSGYSRLLAERIRAVLEQYAERSQSLDQSFPSRLLNEFQTDKHSVVSDEYLNKLLMDLDTKRFRLREAGLLEKEEPLVTLPNQVKGDVKRVLGLYLNDVEDKLSTFDQILNRIELFREILREHFSYKRLLISKDQGFHFSTSQGSILSAAKLSSGEQHMLILLYELLFADDDDSLILIDEPEISLHISWQLSFLNDLEKIAAINHNDILLATHSPQIIGDRVDLTVELEDSRTVERR